MDDGQTGCDGQTAIVILSSDDFGSVKCGHVYPSGHGFFNFKAEDNVSPDLFKSFKCPNLAKIA